MPGRGQSGARVARGPDGAFVGRDDLLDELTAVAGAAAGGSGSVVLLTGEAGIGKTSVARVLARQVRDAFAVSWGTCTVDRSAPPFWPWRDLVAPPAATDQDGDRAIGAERYEALTDLRDQLLERARRGPLLHVIEDLQWADVASVLLLVHLGATIIDAPILVVATLRTGESLSRALDDALEDVRRTARVRPLLPLGDDDIEALIRDAGIQPDADLPALVQARTGGNPLFVSELLRAVHGADSAEGRATALALAVPTRVSELVSHRVARLPTAVAEVLVTAAVVGAEGDARTLAAAHGASVPSVLDLLEQARAAHLLDAAPPGRWRFRHQLIRDAVYAEVAGPDRARHHATVLEALAADTSTPTSVVAHHALAAQPLFDADRAVALAARAGESAFAQHAYEEAVTWFERALAAAPADTGPRWRAELLVLCGEARRQIGDIEAARRAFLAAAELDRRPGTARPRRAGLRRPRRRPRHRLPERRTGGGRPPRPRARRAAHRAVRRPT